jgi:hypothetical protein
MNSEKGKVEANKKGRLTSIDLIEIETLTLFTVDGIKK